MTQPQLLSRKQMIPALALGLLLSPAALQAQEPKLRTTLKDAFPGVLEKFAGMEREGPRKGVALFLSGDGKTVAVEYTPLVNGKLQSRAEIALWDVAADKRTGKGGSAGTGDPAAGAVAFSLDGKSVALAGDRLISLATPRAGNDFFLIKGFSDPKGELPLVYSLAFSPDGKTLASGGDDGIVRLWSVAKLGFVSKLTGTKTRGIAITALAHSPDGKLLAAGDANGDIDIWDLKSSKVASAIKTKSGKILSMAISPDGKALATGVGTITSWEVASGKNVATWKNAGQAIAFTADGKTLVSWGGYRVLFTDVASGMTRAVVQDVTVRPALSADGKTLATGDDKGAIKVWDMPVAK